MVISTIRYFLPGLTVLTVLSGCGHGERESLDRFSKAYAAFRDAEFLALVSAVELSLPTEGHQNDGGYKNSLEHVLEMDEPNASRCKYARDAIQANEVYINALLNRFDENSSKLSDSVLALIEAASAIATAPTSDEALKIAHKARGIEEIYNSCRVAYRNIYRLRREMLQAVVDNGGSFPRSEVVRGGPKIGELVAQVNQLFEQNHTDSQRLVDAFASFRVKVGMREYPTKWPTDRVKPQ